MIKTCCIIGSPEIPAGLAVNELKKEILLAINDGYTHFISGFEKGVGLLFSLIVIELKSAYPTLILEAAIPYRGRFKTPDKLFHHLLSKCNIIGIHSEDYGPDSFIIRNRYMITASQRIITIFSEKTKDQILQMVSYAHMLNKEIKNIKIP